MNRNDLDNYFMRPQFVEGIGNVYPISILNYERFRILANKYITQGITTLHNIYKVDKSVNELDYFVENSIKMDTEISRLKEIKNLTPNNEEEQKQYDELMQLLNLYDTGKVIIYSIFELEELFSMLLKKQVVFKYNSNNLQDYIFQVENENLFITKDNFNEFKDIVMWQNLLYEMPSSESEFINERIQKTIELNSKDNKGGDLCAMISVVGIERGLSDDDIFKYTYYRLYYDYMVINRKFSNLFIYMLRSQGCSEAKIQELSEAVDLYFDPMDLIVDRKAKINGNGLEKQLHAK
jgi:hypothetical protein